MCCSLQWWNRGFLSEDRLSMKRIGVTGRPKTELLHLTKMPLFRMLTNIWKYTKIDLIFRVEFCHKAWYFATVWWTSSEAGKRRTAQTGDWRLDVIAWSKLTACFLGQKAIECFFKGIWKYRRLVLYESNGLQCCYIYRQVMYRCFGMVYCEGRNGILVLFNFVCFCKPVLCVMFVYIGSVSCPWAGDCWRKNGIYRGES